MGPGLDLSRGGLVAPAPGSRERLGDWCGAWAREVGWEATPVAASDEAAFVRAFREAGEAAGVVAVPGAFAGSQAVAGAVRAAGRPVVVVHPGRRPDAGPVGPAGVRVVWGRGIDGCRWALHHLAHRASWPYRTRAYGRDPEQVGELRTPSGDGPHPVAVLVHGGFWLAPWERDLMEGVAVDLARRGIASWNIEYRRVGAGGGWPVAVDDVAAGVAHVAALAGEHGLDPGDVALVGHSAGAHLALLAASPATGSPVDVSRGGVTVRRVVALAPLTDLAAAARGRLGGGAVDGFLSGADPSEASPIGRVPLGIPQLLAHARDDRLVPVDQTRRHAAAARRAGDPVIVLEFDDGDHFSLIDASSAGWQRVAAAIRPGGPDGSR